jgi:hypothetical protein
MSTNPVNLIVVATPPDQTTTANNPVADGIKANAVDSDSSQTLTYSATGLPDGISVDPSTGIFNGTPTTVADAVTVTVSVTDGTGATASGTFNWTIVEPPPIVINMDY